MEAQRALGRANTTSSAKSFLARTLTRHGTAPSDRSNGPKGPLGITTLYDPGPDHSTVADLIFVHGLNGGSQSTWSKGNSPSLFWPQEWLPLDDGFQDTRIHTFGYASGISTSSILNVRDFARSLLGAIKDNPLMNRGVPPPLIFVAHSMGGLVVKKAHILGHQEPEFQQVIDRVSSIVFLGTPHQGAAIAQTLARLVALMGARPFVDDLLPQSPMLQSINEDFPRSAGKLQLMSFYETRPMNVGGVKAMIVEKNSAVMNSPNERRTLLDADHRNLAMFSSPNDPTFVTVRNALATIISSHRDESKARKKQVEQQDQISLAKFLGVSSAPEDDIMTQDSLRLPGSCEWLSGKEWYQSWKQALDSNLVWLRGRPGAGKSVLAGHAVNDARLDGKDCCFYFFQGSDKTKSSPNTFLRSMAWQMAMLHPEILPRVRELSIGFYQDPIDRVDCNAIWRKVYLSGILNIRLNRPQIWVIDAMDECTNSVEVMGFLARMQEQWPLSILITSRDPMEAHIGKANFRTEVNSHNISESDSMNDISLLLMSNLNLLPCPASEKWPSPASMASQIIKNSDGCFLWASLICSELHEVTSEREIEEVLQSIPSDMDVLYSRILHDMANARFGKDLVRAFLTWTTYAFRPLSVFEIQEPIELDINDRIDDVERAISKCCGNIIFTDTQNKVRLVHSTAREFLSRQNVAPDFMVSKADGHRRLAKVCLEFLIKSSRGASKPGRLGSDPEIRTLKHSSGEAPRPIRLGSEPEIRHVQRLSTSQPRPFDEHPFTNYACKYVFQHINMVSSTDEQILELLAKFMSSNSVLRWIEFIATHGDLHTVYQAGKTINGLLSRRAKHSPPLGLAKGRQRLKLLERWGGDLVHIITKFSSRLRADPHSIHHLIPPFCPPDSAIRQQFSNPYRGLNVLGLSRRGWDDCLTTITYAQGMRPNVVAAGPGKFAVGMMNTRGDVKIYGDSIFDESLQLSHGEPVWRLAFAETGQYLASAGAKIVRIWSTSEGQEIANFKLSSLCLALQFSEEDTVLRVATRQNQLIEFDLLGHSFLREEPVSWAADLEETMQFRSPTMTALGSAVGLLCVIYRGENIVLWDYLEDRIHDVYEKETGSVVAYGSHKLAEGTTTVGSVTFSHAIDTKLLAAAYTDGDLIVYDTVSGEAIAVAEGVNVNLVSASPDGRTLAGVDSHGNLTLFDFDTLRSLCRIKLDDPVVPKALTFTADSLRLIEIRGQQCRVWEPTVLLRTDTKDDDNSDTVSITTDPQDVDYYTSKDVSITVLSCAKTQDVVFYGTTEGCVYACNTSGEPQSLLAFMQIRDCPIHILYFDEEASVLTSGDRSGLVTSRKLLRRSVSRQHSPWEASKPSLELKATDGGQDTLIGAISSARYSRILLSTEKSHTLRDMSSEGHDLVAQIEGEQEVRWLPHPTRSECVIHISQSRFKLYAWENLQLLSVVSPVEEVCIDRLVPLHHVPYIATVSLTPEKSGTMQPHSQSKISHIQVWDGKNLDITPNVSPVQRLDQDVADQVELIIGGFGFRMVLLTKDYWVASIDLQAPDNIIPPRQSLIRHFFLPNDWIAVDHKRLIFGIGHSGEIIFAKYSELAVIRRGLEITEAGGSFNPRRGSAGGFHRSSLSVRSRGESPVPSSGSSRPGLD